MAVFSKESEKQLIQIESEELVYDLDKEGNVKTNISQLPYGEQSIIQYLDVNFDGVKDLAIMDGQNSCYHLPSFQVYLDQSGELVHSPEFTRLAQEYCGLFSVNYKEETISTMQKSGCCWHQFSKFKIENGVPKLTTLGELESDVVYHTTKLIEYDGDEKTETTEKRVSLDKKEVNEVISFHLKKNGKKAIIFQLNNRWLNYALLEKDDLVEFNFPLVSYEATKSDFHLNETRDTLTFSNKDAIYQVYETRDQGAITDLGILVTFQGKQYDLKGDPETRCGSLIYVNDSMNNVMIQ